MDRFQRTQRIIEEWTPTEPGIRVLTLGTAVVELLLGNGVLRYDAPSQTYFCPMGALGMGVHGFADIPVRVSETFPHLILIEYSDGTMDTNGEAGTGYPRP